MPPIIQTYGTLENPTHQAIRKTQAVDSRFSADTPCTPSHSAGQLNIGLVMRGLSYYLFPIKPHVSA